LILTLLCRSADSLGLSPDAYHPFSHQLSQIVEEEERQSSRNSLDKEQEDGRKKDENICVNVNIDVSNNEKIKSDENELNISNDEITMNISTDESEKTDTSDVNDSELNVSKDSVAESDISEDSSDSAQSKSGTNSQIQECFSGTVASSTKTRITRT